MSHKKGMNLTRFYYGIKRMPTLLCMFVTLFGCVSMQVHGQQSLFDRLTNDRFIFGLQNGEEYDTDEDSDTETEDEYDFDKASETGSETGGGQQTGESTEQQTDKALTQQTDKATERQTGKETSESDIRQNNTADTNSKETASKHDYFFRYVHSVHKGARISAGISGHGYIGYLQLESPMSVPYFELSVRNFGVGLYPLAALQSSFPEKNIPTLFLGAGNLTFDSFLKAAHFTGFSKTKASYGGVKFPREQFIGIGGAKKAVQYGIEVYGSGWNGVFFASPEPKKQRMRYGIMGGWRMNQKKADINFAVQYLTTFMPELIREVKTSSAQSAGGGASAGQPAGTSNTSLDINGEYTRQRYHTLFGLNAVFTHPIVSFSTTGFCSYAADKTVSGAVQAEIDAWYRYAGIRTGGSYTGARAVNWDGKQQNEQVTAFIQPHFKIGLFSLFALYGFSMEDRTMLHNGGLITQVKHKVIRWKASWDYRNELHTIKTEITCISQPKWFNGVQWFQKAAAGASVELQDNNVNPFILKKYAVHINGHFCITNGVFCGINGLFSQAILKEESENERFIYLQSPVYGGGVYVSFKRNGIGKIHSGKLEVSVKNEKPYFDIKLGYQIRAANVSATF
ncbi:hypothetical protein HMPREF9195_00229 [Treponema medium ATCC 700293]|uniref:Uncharacterized protein n=4 Tax=Treponema medium TaxID=58231 RepID=A0AA87TFH4_TREMD|nr:hypothetical protein HMPREF9195_00229 [Treponema medium ATCC 700293]